jgi:hypothetical protein
MQYRHNSLDHVQYFAMFTNNVFSLLLNKWVDEMERETDLINKAMEKFWQTTGMKVVRRTKVPKAGIHAPDGLVRIQHENRYWDFTIETKKRITRAAVAIEKAQKAEHTEDCILVTEYVTPPLADLMKEMGLFFMDLAGNAYIKKPPFYVFVKGNKLAEKLKPATTKRLFKTAGLKVVFTLLDAPERVNLPYRQIAGMTDVALGTVDWVFRDLKEMRFLVDMGGRKRRMTNPVNLLKRWVEAYPDQLRPKLGIERFKADYTDWWQDVDILNYNACWGGEVAAEKITRHLKPEKVIIYAPEPPGKLIIEKKLHKTTAGNIEILKPFWKFDHQFMNLGTAPPLLVYADLMATGDDRNLETAGIIYDRYLAQPDR